MKNRLQSLFADRSAIFIGMPALVWQVIFFYIPLFFMFYLSFNDSIDQGYYTISNYSSLFKSSYIPVIFRSLLLALFTSLSCLIIGYPLAYFLSFIAGRAKIFYLFLLILPFWTNFLLHIYAWFYVLERGGFLNRILLWTGLIPEPIKFLNSTAAVMLVMVYCYLPFMTLPIYSILEKFDRRLIEASKDLGATSWQTFTKIVVPLILPGIQSGLFLVFVPAFGEFAIPALLGGDRNMYVGNVIVQYILGTDTMSLGAAFTVAVSIILLLFILFFAFIIKKVIKD